MSEKEPGSKNAWIIPIAVAAVGAISTVLVALISKPPAPPTPTPTPTVAVIGKSVISKDGTVQPTVDFALKSEKPRLRIGNTASQSSIEVSNLTLHWSCEKCPRLETPEPSEPDDIKEYRYSVNVTESSGSKLLDPRIFNYAAGEIDDYFIYIEYPGNGVYHFWIDLNYVESGGKTPKSYKTPENLVKECESEK